VGGEQLVVLLLGQELHSRTGQFGAHEKRLDPGCDEEEERRDEVEDADLLGIGGAEQLEHGVAGERPAQRAGEAAELGRGQDRGLAVLAGLDRCPFGHSSPRGETVTGG
jgi:hypothetical protein